MSNLRESLSEAQIKRNKTESVMNGVGRWTSFYRENPHRFVEDYLNIKLDKFQQIILCMMFRFSNSIFLACRGLGKSFLLAVFCAAFCILYPESKICIASKTKKQATEVIDKIKDILMPKSGNLRAEIDEVQINQVNTFVSFKNGSKIVVVTASETARHNRATVLIVDEFRMVDKNTIDMVLRKFLTSQRHPGFLDKDKYKDYPKEKTKELYASSCWYESHWSYELIRTYVVNMIRGRSYFCCSIPYQLAIKEGRLDKEKIEDEMSESTFNSITFQMEMEALYFGKGSGGLYNLDEIEKNRKIIYPMLPYSLKGKISDKKIVIPNKEQDEIRILSADIALMSSSKHKNDATSIFLNQMKLKPNNRYENNIVFADNNEGLRTDEQAIRIRRLVEEYDVDYLALDTRGLGIGVCDALMSPLYDKETGITYGALSCCNNDEIAMRCVDQSAPKKIWSIQGSPEFNSQCALSLRESLKKGDTKLLISEYDAEDALAELKGYDSLNNSEKLDLKLPYIHTSLLINELINLEYETKNNVVKVKEKSGMRKDRYSSLSYNVFVAKNIERDFIFNKQKNNLEDLVLNYRAPKISKYHKGGRR